MSAILSVCLISLLIRPLWISICLFLDQFKCLSKLYRISRNKPFQRKSWYFGRIHATHSYQIANNKWDYCCPQNITNLGCGHLLLPNLLPYCPYLQHRLHRWCLWRSWDADATDHCHLCWMVLSQAQWYIPARNTFRWKISYKQAADLRIKSV